MRRSERLPVELIVTWNRAGRLITCVATDINEHGIFLRTDQIVERESLLHLAVQLPDRMLEMFATARFVRASDRGRGIGVEILLIDDVSRSHWIAFYDRVCVEHAHARKAVAMGG